MSSSAGEGSPEEQPSPDLAAEATAAKALALASVLSETLGEIARRLDLYSAFGRRSRRIIIALAVSFALDIVFTVVLGLTAFSAHGTANANALLVGELHAQQAALHTAQLTACANGNVFRADQNVIWEDFVRILTTPTASSTKAQIAQADKLAAQFLAYVATVNHPMNCTALYGK